MARVVLVSGGARGIGAAVSLAFLQALYKVVPTYLADRAAAEASRNMTGLTPYRWNVGDFEACSEGIKEVEAAVGPVDVLVNNAGIVRDVALHKMDREKWKEVIDADLGGAFNMCRVVIEGMRARKFGRIINVSSIKWSERAVWADQLFCCEGRIAGIHTRIGPRVRTHGDHRQRDMSRIY